MKQFFKSMMLLGVVASLFAACESEVNNTTTDTVEKIKVEVAANLDGTRSSFDEKAEGATTYTSSWSGSEIALFSLNEAELVATQNAVNAAGKSAIFAPEFTADDQTEGIIYAFAPQGTTKIGGVRSISSEHHDVTTNVPTIQNPTTTSCDEAVHMVYAMEEYTGDIPTNVAMTFQHMLAYGKMTIKGIEKEIKSVSFTAPKAIAGTACYFYYNTRTWGHTDEATITINNPAANNYTFWFGCVPAELNEGTLIVIAKTADGYTYTKNIELGTKTLAFNIGQVSTFSINMTDATEKAPATVEDGNYAIIIEKGGVYYAMSAENAGDSSTKKNQRMAVALEDYDGGESYITTNDNLIWSVSKSDNVYHIMFGEEYLVGVSGNNYARLDSTADNLTFNDNDDGSFQVVSSIASDEPRNLSYYSGVFAFYKASTTNGSTNYADSIRFVAVEKSSAPVLEVAESEVALGVTATEGTIAVTAQNLTEGISVTNSGSEWLTATYADGVLSYSAAANTSSERTATVTLSANGVSATVTFTQDAYVAGQVTDILNKTFTGIASSYGSWNNNNSNSGAVYEGISAGGNSSIQLTNSSANGTPGIITTTSGGKAKKVTITWYSGSSTAAKNRTLNIYGSNTAYTATSDLTDASKQGSLISTVAFNTNSVEVEPDEDYEYIGFFAPDGAIYVSKIEIVWE